MELQTSSAAGGAAALAPARRRPSTPARIAASRANGVKSRGPVTAAGKARSSRNSTRHGLLSKTSSPSQEQAETYRNLYVELHESLRPTTPAEEVLVETMAAARCGELRAYHAQAAAMNAEIAKQDPSLPPATRGAIAFRNLAEHSRTLHALYRYEAHFDRLFTRALLALIAGRKRPIAFQQNCETNPSRPESQPSAETQDYQTNPRSNSKQTAIIPSIVPVHQTELASRPIPLPASRAQIPSPGCTRPSTLIYCTAGEHFPRNHMATDLKGSLSPGKPDILWTKRGFAQTSRPDRWWVSPLLVFLGFGTFLVYGTWAAFQNAYYTSGPYISPFYSPEIFGSSPHAWFPVPSWFPSFLPFSPALLILWIPGGFRFTCYYYRGAYYKSFWADPPACAVGEPRKSYLGERWFPLVMQNFHRYFLRLSYIVWAFLVWDVWKALWFPDGFGIGVGTIVLAVNVVLIAMYIFGCHAFRHLIGGGFDRISEHPVRHKLYDCASCLNGKHKVWAWASLCSVLFADIYVRLCSMGIWTDWRIL